jgi:hypothetical protein
MMARYFIGIPEEVVDSQSLMEVSVRSWRILTDSDGSMS